MKIFSALLACSAMLYFVAGCGPTKAPAPAAKPRADSQDHGHDHPAHGAGPHGGTLTDWGGGAYHVEFTVDHGKKEVTVYILGGDEKTPAPIKAETIHLTINEPATELDLTAQPLDGEAEGTSSRFVGTHDTIGIVREFEGTITGNIEGTPYNGDFKELPHAEEHQK